MCVMTDQISVGGLGLPLVKRQVTDYSEITKLSMTQMSSEERVNVLSIRWHKAVVRLVFCIILHVPISSQCQKRRMCCQTLSGHEMQGEHMP